ncbi:hypothetical protein OQA88_2238 [Cercophora sp. LCS_1]
MSADKRNEFLDAGDSDDEVVRDNDSDDELQKGGRSAKRRRVENEESDVDDFSNEDEDVEDGGADLGDRSTDDTKQKTDETTGEGKREKKSKLEGKDDELPGVTKPLSKKSLIQTEAAIKKSGVVYISRVPPYMNPAKLRSLLEPYGKINRLFLAPEDPTARARRVKSGGNKKKSFTEGWVEFVKKKDAKKVCELLNGQTIGGKKGTYYRDDIWTLLYLSGFKWQDLTRQIAAENAERASRMRAEISKTIKENKEFVRNVEKAKMLDGIQSKAAAKKKQAPESAVDADAPPAAEAGSSKDRTRTFAQVPLAKKRKFDVEQPEQVQRVLSKIF